ncbi:hypothetical protein D030_3647B, partial [Vibrio parahaemolyticus AQ3810]
QRICPPSAIQSTLLNLEYGLHNRPLLSCQKAVRELAIKRLRPVQNPEHQQEEEKVSFG